MQLATETNSANGKIDVTTSRNPIKYIDFELHKMKIAQARLSTAICSLRAEVDTMSVSIASLNELRMIFQSERKNMGEQNEFA